MKKFKHYKLWFMPEPYPIRLEIKAVDEANAEDIARARYELKDYVLARVQIIEEK